MTSWPSLRRQIFPLQSPGVRAASYIWPGPWSGSLQTAACCPHPFPTHCIPHLAGRVIWHWAS